MRTLVPWIALFVGSVMAGCATCAALVVRGRAVAATALTAVATGLGAAMAVFAVAQSSGRADATVTAAFIGLGCYIGGFALAAALVPSLTKLPPLPGPLGALPAPASRDTVAFLLVAEGQPETYDPAVLTRSYALLSETEVPAPPDAVRVFAYLSDRVRYRSTGLSPSRPVVRAVAARMTEHLRDMGWTGPVTEAWLAGTPRVADAVHALAIEGARDIVVVFLGVAETLPYGRARIEVEAVAPPGSGVRVCYSHTLWADDALAGLVADKVLAALPRGLRPTDGVVLAGTGQPWQWDRDSPESCEHETFFLQRVRAALLSIGAQDSNVRTAWLDWQDPGVTEVVRHLAALGCQRIVVMPATTCADTLETVIDLPAAVAQADLDPAIRVSVLHGWGDEAAVAEALARAADETATACGLGPDQ